MLLPVLLLLAAQAQDAPRPDPKGDYYRPTQATIMVEPVAMMLAGFDADGDGRITRAEAQAGIAKSFGREDKGYIAYSDWAEKWLGDRNAIPSPFETDRNGDNRVSLDEVQARIDAIFTRLDVDKDGVLTHKELLTIRGSTIGGDRRQGGPGGGQGGRPPRR